MAHVSNDGAERFQNDERQVRVKNQDGERQVRVKNQDGERQARVKNQDGERQVQLRNMLVTGNGTCLHVFEDDQNANDD
jgi:flagellar hook protein FlgE